MPTALDFGGSPVAIGELQSGVEDYSASQSAEYGLEHGSDGRHTKPFQELTVHGPMSATGAVTVGDDFLMTGDFDVTLTADTDNLREPDGSPITSAAIRLQATVPVELSGLVPPSNATHIRILENGANETITLVHNGSGSDAANRFSLPNDTDYRLLSGQIAFAKYDRASEIWRVLVSGGLMIRSVQRGTVTLTGTQTSHSTSLSPSVDPTRCRLTNLGSTFSTTSTGAASNYPYLTLSGAQVTANRGSADDLGSETITTGYEVFEYF